MVHNYAVEVFCLLRDPERTRRSAEATVNLASELANPFRRAIGEFYLGWCDSLEQDVAEAITRMQRALADFRATGSLTVTSFLLSLIAQAQCSSGRFKEALAAIDEALAAIEQTGERAFEAEVHRAGGEVYLATDSLKVERAEHSFRTAIDIARRQNAKSWELRATMSLARLMRDTNRRDEARVMLTDIYNWFTEGFDTADLKDAKALLDELKN
ncbi:MAG TPA: hypothetical protein VMT64_00905 [Candidatus Binataceae bacterium]|nr:hypothetical protein [Candidatus Binataceae bacterium]